MSRLPTPGGDDNDWGSVLNDFLSQSLNADGSLNTNAVASASPSASTTNKGIVQLAGDLGGTATAPTVARVNGITVSGTPSTSGQVLTSSSTSAANWSTPANGVQLDASASDIQPLGTAAAGSTGKAADAGHIHAMPRLDQTLTPTAAVSLGGQKITNIANGTGATDAAAFGQIPVAGTGAGTYAAGNDSRITGAIQSGSAAGNDLSGTYPNPTVAKISGVTINGGGTLATSQSLVATSTSTAQWSTRDFNVMAFGATGNGTTDDTAAIQAALNAAGTAKGVVYFPAAPGGCYRTSGLSVPSGVVALVGQSELYRAGGSSVAYLTGSVLAPLNSSSTTLLTVGTNGNGTVVNTNPHGLTIDGIGFLGTLASGACAPGMWGVIVNDTSDVTLIRCRDLFCDTVLGGGPSGGLGTGGFAQYLSSASGNGFSENGRILFCGSYGASKFLSVDGSVTSAGGSTDGRVVSCQLNSHNKGILLGPTNAGCGGWSIVECHFSSTNGLGHINYGTVGNPWTLRVQSCYFDVSASSHIICSGRGLQVIGNYFRAGTNTIAINFGSGLNHSGRDPAAVITGNFFDLNGSSTALAFVRFQGFTASAFATSGGGEYRSNVVHNHGAAMPASWVAQFIGSDATPVAIANTTIATLDINQGPVLSS